jgi:hypothetical protein
MVLPQRVLSVLLVTLMYGAACILLNTFGIQLGAPAVLAVPILLFLVVTPGRALIFAWCCLAFLPMLIREYMGQSAYNIVNEGVVAVLWLSWIARILLVGHVSGVPKPLLHMGMVVLVTSGISVVVNGSNPVYWIEWVLTYLLPLPVLAISRVYLKHYTPRRLMRIAVVFLGIQFALNFSWHAGINPLRNHHLWLDLACGSYGNTAATAYIMLAAITGGICFIVSPKQRLKPQFFGLLLTVVAFIQFVFAFTVHAYLFLPVALVISVYFFPKVNGQTSIRLINALLVLSLAFVLIVPLVRSSSRHRHYSSSASTVEYGVKAWRSVWHGPKIAVIRRVVKTADRLQLAVGMGPNSAVSYTGLKLNSPQTHWLVGEWYNTYSGRKELGTGSIRENLFSGTVMLLSEIGLIGMFPYLLLLVYPLFHLMKRMRQRNDGGPEMRFLLGAVVMLLVTNLLVGIVWDVWRIRMLSLTIWLLLGRIWDAEEPVAPDLVAHDSATLGQGAQ